ncbi:MAG TPA: hypothetical protein VF062_19205 [Candidatus Limnocylindrales bacterium]
MVDAREESRSLVFVPSLVYGGRLVLIATTALLATAAVFVWGLPWRPVLQTATAMCLILGLSGLAPSAKRSNS